MRTHAAPTHLLVAFALLAVSISGAAASEAKPTITPLALDIAMDDLVVGARESVDVALTVQARIDCAVGFEAPEKLSGQLVAVDQKGTEWGRAPFIGTWHRQDSTANSYVLFEQITFRVPADGATPAPGVYQLALRVAPDAASPTPGRCQADGYRAEPGEAEFSVTIVSASTMEGASALASEENRGVVILPMAIALSLVGLLVLFAVRRERARNNQK